MIVLKGASHRSCPVELREKLAARPASAALDALRSKGVSEAVVLSTCNRFEVYAAVEDRSGSSVLPLLDAVLEELAGSALGESAYTLQGAEAVHHLFRVSAGLDSLVLGEAEILGQVKQAYETARGSGMTGKLTNVLFQRALFVGKKVRTDTGIALGHTSVASVAVDLAERIFGSLREKEVLILGAGKMAELTSKHLASCKIGRLIVANRTHERARELAARFKGEPAAWERFPALLETVDIVIGSTGADRPVVTRSMVEAAMPARKGRSLFFIDIAMPRDVEESVHELDHVYAYALHDLQDVVRENVERRKGEFEAASRLVEQKAGEFAAWERTVGSEAEASLKHGRSQAQAPAERA